MHLAIALLIFTSEPSNPADALAKDNNLARYAKNICGIRQDDKPIEIKSFGGAHYHFTKSNRTIFYFPFQIFSVHSFIVCLNRQNTPEHIVIINKNRPPHPLSKNDKKHAKLYDAMQKYIREWMDAYKVRELLREKLKKYRK